MAGTAVGCGICARRTSAAGSRWRSRPPARTGAWRLTFAVRAVDAEGLPVAEGEIDRAVVDRRRFLEGDL
ncbi:hypothetical protein [Streptomyces murinus]|uniref:hypothetical protein n=1 Tax=Streptomyces murinus TaxID=33900 RepID=UPI001F3228E2|nr:hypothetical protein [Streptomyces murinus]